MKKGTIAGCSKTHKHNNRTYWFITINGNRYRAHRLAWVYVYGSIDDDLQIDHINNDGLDNRINNLRLVTGQENLKNKRKYKTNKTGVTGVRRLPSGKWAARITCNGKFYYLGTHDTIEKATLARENKKKELGFTKEHGHD